MTASLMQPGDILLAISHSGQTTDIIQMVKAANEHGAETICLTNYPNSPLSLIAKHSIISSVKNNPITGKMPPRVLSTSIFWMPFLPLSPAKPAKRAKPVYTTPEMRWRPNAPPIKGRNDET